ncbi:MAG: hypothetical protein MR270_01920, partial [Erysipelotrichaceae bacterium]|nr:hypothetical protein [Erysipelotrichaceae bacterium]
NLKTTPAKKQSVAKELNKLYTYPATRHIDFFETYIQRLKLEGILRLWRLGVCLLLHIFMDTFFINNTTPDLSPFVCVCSTVKSTSQRQK